MILPEAKEMNLDMLMSPKLLQEFVRLEMWNWRMREEL